MQDKTDLSFEDKGDGTGPGHAPPLSFSKPDGDVKPPLKPGGAGAAAVVPEDDSGEKDEGHQEAALTGGKIPLQPALIRVPLRAEGLLLAEVLKYPEFAYTEEELNDLSALAECLNIELDPKYQIIIALVSIHAVKFMGYIAHRRAQRAAANSAAGGPVSAAAAVEAAKPPKD